MRPPSPPANPDKYAPSNIFAAMKKTDFGKPEEQRPQESGKYDALRPLATGECSSSTRTDICSVEAELTLCAGYNGAPGMMPQQTGMMNNGMMPQMTGYNPQLMGYMGQQNPYGQQGYR